MMTIRYAKRLRGWRFILFNIVLSLGHIVVLFSVGSYIALLPHVVGDLGGVLPSFGTWGQTYFIIAVALAFPVARWLSGLLGDYHLFNIAFIGYAGASYICATSQSLGIFIIARILLGFLGGITLFIGQILLLKEYPDPLKLRGLGVWGLVTLIPFTVSFPIGGLIADEFGWRYLFYLNIPFALGIAATTGSLLAGRGFEYQHSRFDTLGFVLLALILGSLQTLFNMGNDFDWLDSPILLRMFWIVLLAVPSFMVWEWRFNGSHPVFNLRLFGHRNFTIGVLCLTLGFFLIQGILSVLIVQLQVLLGYSSFLAGMAFLPMILLAMPVAVLMQNLPKELDVRIPACLNLLGFSATFYWLGLYDDPESFDQLFWPMLLLGLFLGSFFLPLTKLTLHGLSGNQQIRAAEEAAFLRIIAGAFGITLQGVLLFRRTPFHQLDLADFFGGRRLSSLNLVQEFSARLAFSGIDKSLITRRLLSLIKQHAAILALDDIFLLASYLFLGLAGLVWLAYPSHLPIHPTEKEEIADILAEEILEEQT